MRLLNYVLPAIPAVAFVAAASTSAADFSGATNTSTNHWLAAHVVPLSSLNVHTPSADLRPIEKLVGNARVVALGEPRHTAHEPLAARNRIARFLVEEKNFTVIALETGFTEADAISRFVNGEPGDLNKIVRENLFAGSLLENRNLIEWMRDYNRNPDTIRKVRFYGFDLTGGWNGAYPRARKAIEFSLELLNRADEPAAARLRAELQTWLPKFTSSEYHSLPDSVRGKIPSELSKIDSVLHSKRQAIENISSPEQFGYALQSIVVARQLHRMFELAPAELWTSRSIPAESDEAMSARDAGMAENVQWIIDREGADARILLFAHNGHVSAEPLTGGVWSSFRKPPRMLGSYLRPSLGRDLLIIGSVGAGHMTDPASIDVTFASVNTPYFVLDLRASNPTQPFSTWLAAAHRLGANDNTFSIVHPNKAFDAFLYLNKLTPAQSY